MPRRRNERDEIIRNLLLIIMGLGLLMILAALIGAVLLAR